MISYVKKNWIPYPLQQGRVIFRELEVECLKCMKVKQIQCNTIIIKLFSPNEIMTSSVDKGRNVKVCGGVGESVQDSCG